MAMADIALFGELLLSSKVVESVKTGWGRQL